MTPFETIIKEHLEKKAGVRLETIEVDTNRWRILQCRGRFNKDSAHHKEILSLMEKNMNKLRQAI